MYLVIKNQKGGFIVEQTIREVLNRDFREFQTNDVIYKALVFIYALKKSNISYPVYKENLYNIEEYFRTLLDLTKRKLSEIEKTCDSDFNNLIKDCIVSFSCYIPSYSKIKYFMPIINKMTEEDIKVFFINDISLLDIRDEFGTPATLVDLIIKLLVNKKTESCFDLGSGCGDFLVKLGNLYPNIKCYGVEINERMSLLSRIRLYFAGINSFIINSDILFTEFKEECDIAFANTPLSMRLYNVRDGYNSYNKYVRNVRNIQNADWIFADRLLQTFKNRGAILMTEASLMNYVDIEQRKDMIQQNLIEGVIKFPRNILSYAGGVFCLVIFNKNKDTQDIKFLDASKMCTKGRKLSELNVEEIINAYNSNEQVTIVDISKISTDDYSLNVNKYKDVTNLILENETTLETVVEEIFRGAQIPAFKLDNFAKVDENDQIYKLLSVGDIQNNTFNKDKLQIIKNDGKLDRYLLKEGDVVVSSKSTKIKTAVVDLLGDEKIVATGSLLVIRCDEEKINPFYLKTFFDSSIGSKILESIQTGSTIISINASALLKMRIPLIKKSRQDYIAKRFLINLDQFKLLEMRLSKLEKEIKEIFDNSVGE